MKGLNVAGIVLIILALIMLVILFRDKTIDSFIVFLEDVIIPKDCYNYILTDGNSYFLLNTNKLFDSETNPMKFKTLNDAKNYLSRLKYIHSDGSSVKCPVNIPVVNFVQKKKTNDPTVSLQRECNKKIAPNLFDLDVCTAYGDSKGIVINKEKENIIKTKLNVLEKDIRQYSNYDLETCMIDSAVKENPELDDINFKTYFADYFSRLDDTIDAGFSYLTM